MMEFFPNISLFLLRTTIYVFSIVTYDNITWNYSFIIVCETEILLFFQNLQNLYCTAIDLPRVRNYTIIHAISLLTQTVWVPKSNLESSFISKINFTTPGCQPRPLLNLEPSTKQRLASDWQLLEDGWLPRKSWFQFQKLSQIFSQQFFCIR